MNINDIDNVIPSLLNNPSQYANSISTDELANILQQLSYHYYNTETELVPDSIYDLLRDILESRDPKHPYLKIIGAPINKEKVKLPYYMPSLNKIKPDTDELDKFISKYKGPYVLSDKLDGVSALFIKSHNGKNDKMYTRGDGTYGQYISYLIPYVYILSFLPL
jgi:NAD-dependent DNA ligase